MGTRADDAMRNEGVLISIRIRATVTNEDEIYLNMALHPGAILVTFSAHVFKILTLLNFTSKSGHTRVSLWRVLPRPSLNTVIPCNKT